MHAKLLQLCPTLCDSMDYRPPGSSVHGIFQARILESLPFPSPGDLPGPGIKVISPVSLAGRLLTTEPPGNASQNWTLSQTKGWGRKPYPLGRCSAKSHNRGCRCVIVTQEGSEEMRIFIQSTILLPILFCKARLYS